MKRESNESAANNSSIGCVLDSAEITLASAVISDRPRQPSPRSMNEGEIRGGDGELSKLLPRSILPSPGQESGNVLDIIGLMTIGTVVHPPCGNQYCCLQPQNSHLPIEGGGTVLVMPGSINSVYTSASTANMSRE